MIKAKGSNFGTPDFILYPFAFILSSVRSIDVVGLAELGGADDLRGDVVPAVHHVQMHVAVKTFQRMFDE